MLWGFQIAFAFAQTFSVLALFMLHVLERKRFKKSAFVAALGSGTIASFSVAQGLFVWPVGLLQLLIGPLEEQKKKVFIVLWGLVGLVEWVGYFVNYEKPTGAPPLLYVLEHPLAGMEYFLNLLGGSLFWQQSSAFAGGLLLACLAVASLLLIYRGGKLGEYSFWISLLLYSFLTLASITLGRAELGVGQALIGQALVSRYTSFSILVGVCVYAMLVKMAFERRSRLSTILLVALSGVVLLSAAISYSEGIDAGRNVEVAREKAAFVLSTYESQPDEILSESLLPPDPKAVREQHAPTLQRLGYNVFSEPQPRGSLPPLSALSPVAFPSVAVIDSLSTDATSGFETSQQNRSVVVPEEASFIKLSGWAVDASNESAAGGVYVDIDGKLLPAFYGTGRQEVADHFGVPAYRYSGFERAIPVSEIGAGTHELSTVVLTTDRTGYYQPNQQVILEIR